MVVRPRNLADLSTSASTVVVSRVLDAHIEPHPVYKNLPTVVVTLQVLDTWKGSARKTLTFRQFVWDPRDREANGGYRAGDQLLLFLNPTSDAGLTSPVGMQQGRFAVTRAKDGSLVASNGAGVALRQGLTTNTSSAKFSAKASNSLLRPAPSGESIPLDVLKEAVHVYAQSVVAK